MGRMVRALATLAVVIGAATLVASSLAGASGPPNAPLTAGTPLWELHVQKYPGGISNGVRAALAAANANVSAPTTKVQPLAVRPSTVRSGNVQMNDSSYPPLPENETAVALNASNENIAVAASND